MLSSIILLNAMGVSYAYWTDQLQIKTLLTTGSIAPKFDHVWFNVVKNPDDNDGYQSWRDAEKYTDLSVDPNRSDDTTLYITGKVLEGSKVFVHYGITNDSTIPIDYVDTSKAQASGNNENNLQINVSPLGKDKADVIAPGESINNDDSNGNPKIFIRAGNLDQSEESQSYEIPLTELLFKQWNAAKSSEGGN